MEQLIDLDADYRFMELTDGRLHRYAIKGGYAIGVLGRRS